MLIVQKFGGSSLAGIERLRRAAGIIAQARQGGHQIVAVVSAMGDTTDELEKLGLMTASSPSKAEMDALLATGEQQSAALLAMQLESLGCRARSFTGWQAGIFTDSRYSDARIVRIDPGAVENCLARGETAVVSGFQGIDGRGRITTLGRGGSDTTAVALCAALDADCCRIYTDVDGIYTADPRLVTGARLLDAIDSTDMLCLAEAGSQVLHPRCVSLAIEKGVEIQLMSSFVDAPGTRVGHLSENERQPFAGVTRSDARSEITVAGKSAQSALPQIIRAAEAAGLMVMDARSASGSATVKVAREQLLPALEAVHSALFRD